MVTFTQVQQSVGAVYRDTRVGVEDARKEEAPWEPLDFFPSSNFFGLPKVRLYVL